MRMVERREMETGRLNIKETLPDWKLIQLCYYRYVIPSKDLKTGSHVRCKCKRKRKWQCERVHTSNANPGKDRYASAVEVFFQDDRQWLSFCRFTRVGSEHKCKFKKIKMFLSLALTVAFAFGFAFALGCFTRVIPCICICVYVCWGSPCVIDWPREVCTNPITLLGN